MFWRIRMAMKTSSVKEAEITIRDIGFGDSIYVKVKRESNAEVTYLIDTGYLIDSAVYSKKLSEDGIKKSFAKINLQRIYKSLCNTS